MSTGYTSEQIRELEILMNQNRPPEQTAEQLEGAPAATHAVVSGTDKGALVRLAFDQDAPHDFFLNCAVALKLVVDLQGAAREQNWWTGHPQGIEQNRASPTDAEIWAAIKVLSPRTDSAPEGALVSFGSGRTVSQFFMPRNVVHEVLAGLRGLAEHAGWWDDEMRLIPTANR